MRCQGLQFMNSEEMVSYLSTTCTHSAQSKPKIDTYANFDAQISAEMMHIYAVWPSRKRACIILIPSLNPTFI